MFNNKNNAEVEKLNKEIEHLKSRIKDYEEAYGELNNEKNRKIESLTEDHKLAISRLKDQHAHETKLAQAEVDLKIREALQKFQDELTKLKIDNSSLENKVKVYETAFKNLGFDVKDMKDILNKLVDGVVAKNTVQLVK